MFTTSNSTIPSNEVLKDLFSISNWIWCFYIANRPNATYIQFCNYSLDGSLPYTPITPITISDTYTLKPPDSPLLKLQFRSIFRLLLFHVTQNCCKVLLACLKVQISSPSNIG